MTVGDLINLLADMDPEAEVLLMTQEQWPFENEVWAVTTRQEIQRARFEVLEVDPAEYGTEWVLWDRVEQCVEMPLDNRKEGEHLLAKEDTVFLVEGKQVR